MAKELQIQVFDGIGGWGFDLKSLTGQLKGFKGDRINIPINSYGGSVTEGLAIYNTLKGRSEEIETQVVGYAMSMGSVIAMAGDTVSMPKEAYLMIHNPFSVAIGDAEDMQHQADLLESMAQSLANIYARKTGLSVKRIRSMMAKETWMNGKEAKELGFVDKLTKGAEFKAEFSPADLDKYQNIPKDILNKNNKAKNMKSFDLPDFLKNLFEGKAPETEKEAKEAVAKFQEGQAPDAKEEKPKEEPKAGASKDTALEARVAATEKALITMADSFKELTDSTVSGFETIAKNFNAHQGVKVKEQTKEKSEIEQKFAAVAKELNAMKGAKSVENLAEEDEPKLKNKTPEGDSIEFDEDKEFTGQYMKGVFSTN